MKRTMLPDEQAVWEAHPDDQYPRFTTTREHGHLAYALDARTGVHVYADTGEVVDFKNPRPCKKCGAAMEYNGVDPCFGEPLPGVSFACCGHGDPGHAYVKFDNGTIIRGITSIEAPR